MKRLTLVSLLVVGGLVAVAVAGGAWATSDRALPANDPGDLSLVARFSLTVDGHDLGSFSDLGGLSSGVEAIDLVSTSGDGTVKTLLPAKRAPDSVVLSRGLTSNLELQAWHDLVLDGDVAAARKSASLVMYATDGTPVARYHLENAWPSKVDTSQLKSGATSFVTETVTLVCDRIQRVAP